MNALLPRGGLLVLLLILVAGCNVQLPGKPDPADRPLPADKVLSFPALYARTCAGCHGADGTLGPAPPLNDPLFRAIVPRATLEKVLLEGRHGTPMASFAQAKGGPLTPAQIEVILNEIKGQNYHVVRKEVDGQEKVTIVTDLAEIPPEEPLTWGSVPDAPKGTPPYLILGAAGNEERGAKVFARACAGCHGENGMGVVRDDIRHNKINDRAFLALISDHALRRIMITGRPDLGMPDWSDRKGRPEDFQPLSANDLADLVALLSGWRRGHSSPAK